MQCFLLQDYVTIRAAPGLAVFQSECGWLDLTGFQDVVLFCDVKEFSLGGGGATQIFVVFQTSPAPEETLFVITTFFSAALGLTVAQSRKETSTTPLAK